MTIKHPKRDKRIIEEAATWASLLDDADLTRQEREDLATWLRASPQHVKELLLAQALFSEADGMDPEKAISIDALLEQSGAEVVSFSQQKEQRAESRPTKAGLPLFRIAAAALILLGAGLFTIAEFRPFAGTEAKAVLYTTEVGEQREISLADGSTVHLNTGSRLSVRYSSEERAIDLLSGEAFFDVAQEVERPFRVHSNNAVTEALGTSFNIYLKGDATQVAVLSGKVAVSEATNESRTNRLLATIGFTSPARLATLGKGETVTVDKAGNAHPENMINPEVLTSWRKNKLVFENTPLSEIANQFNRYNKTRIVVENLSEAEPHFSGVFATNNPDAFLTILELSRTATISKQGKNTINVQVE